MALTNYLVFQIQAMVFVLRFNDGCRLPIMITYSIIMVHLTYIVACRNSEWRVLKDNVP